jgi:hypothetical protein
VGIGPSRNTCTPDVALALTRVWWETDLRAVLPSVRVPTLLMANSPWARDVAKAGYVAALIPDAEVVLVPGDEWPTSATMQSYLRPALEAVRRFVGLEPARPERSAARWRSSPRSATSASKSAPESAPESAR